MIEGVGEIRWFLFCPFLKYLTRYILQTSYVDENHHFLTYSVKNSVKISSFYDFLAKNWFLLISCIVYFQCIQISLGALTLRRHGDVIWRSMYSFWYQWIEEVHTYTLVAHIWVSGVPYRKSRKGVQQPPSLEDVLQKYIRRTRVKPY